MSAAASERNRNFGTEGIILRRMPLRESSVLLDVMTKNLGMIPVVAQGARKDKGKLVGLLEPNNQLELTLYKTPESKWWYFRSGAYIKSFHADPVTNASMQAAFEILLQLMIHEEDSEYIYELLRRYLEYLQEHRQNSIAIYWRFMLALYRFMGIPLDLEQCVHCNRSGIVISAYYPRHHGFVCADCRKPAMEDFLIHIDSESARILERIPTIGNYLHELQISAKTFRTINRLLRLHAEENLHKQYHWKSLEILEKMLYYA